MISEAFNDYYSSIPKTIRSKIPFTSKHFSDHLKKPNPFSFFMSPVTTIEVESCISSLSNHKSNGPYSIPVNILKLLKPSISEILCKLVNLSFSTGCFPTQLKTSRIVPVFKKGSPLECSNYRPISLSL